VRGAIARKILLFFFCRRRRTRRMTQQPLDLAALSTELMFVTDPLYRGRYNPPTDVVPEPGVRVPRSTLALLPRASTRLDSARTVDDEFFAQTFPMFYDEPGLSAVYARHRAFRLLDRRFFGCAMFYELAHSQLDSELSACFSLTSSVIGRWQSPLVCYRQCRDTVSLLTSPFYHIVVPALLMFADQLDEQRARLVGVSESMFRIAQRVARTALAQFQLFLGVAGATDPDDLAHALGYFVGREVQTLDFALGPHPQLWFSLNTHAAIAFCSSLLAEAGVWTNLHTADYHGGNTLVPLALLEAWVCAPPELREYMLYELMDMQGHAYVVTAPRESVLRELPTDERYALVAVMLRRKLQAAREQLVNELRMRYGLEARLRLPEAFNEQMLVAALLCAANDRWLLAHFYHAQRFDVIDLAVAYGHVTAEVLAALHHNIVHVDWLVAAHTMRTSASELGGRRGARTHYLVPPVPWRGDEVLTSAVECEQVPRWRYAAIAQRLPTPSATHCDRDMRALSECVSVAETLRQCMAAGEGSHTRRVLASFAPQDAIGARLFFEGLLMRFAEYGLHALAAPSAMHMLNGQLWATPEAARALWAHATLAVRYGQPPDKSRKVAVVAAYAYWAREFLTVRNIVCGDARRAVCAALCQLLDTWLHISNVDTLARARAYATDAWLFTPLGHHDQERVSLVEGIVESYVDPLVRTGFFCERRLRACPSLERGYVTSLALVLSSAPGAAASDIVVRVPQCVLLGALAYIVHATDDACQSNEHDLLASNRHMVAVCTLLFAMLTGAANNWHLHELPDYEPEPCSRKGRNDYGDDDDEYDINDVLDGEDDSLATSAPDDNPLHTRPYRTNRHRRALARTLFTDLKQSLSTAEYVNAARDHELVSPDDDDLWTHPELHSPVEAFELPPQPHHAARLLRTAARVALQERRVPVKVGDFHTRRPPPPPPPSSAADALPPAKRPSLSASAVDKPVAVVAVDSSNVDDMPVRAPVEEDASQADRPLQARSVADFYHLNASYNNAGDEEAAAVPPPAPPAPPKRAAAQHQQGRASLQTWQHLGANVMRFLVLCGANGALPPWLTVLLIGTMRERKERVVRPRGFCAVVSDHTEKRRRNGLHAQSNAAAADNDDAESSSASSSTAASGNGRHKRPSKARQPRPLQSFGDRYLLAMTRIRLDMEQCAEAAMATPGADGDDTAADDRLLVELQAVEPDDAAVVMDADSRAARLFGNYGHLDDEDIQYTLAAFSRLERYTQVTEANESALYASYIAQLPSSQCFLASLEYDSLLVCPQRGGTGTPRTTYVFRTFGSTEPRGESAAALAVCESTRMRRELRTLALAAQLVEQACVNMSAYNNSEWEPCGALSRDSALLVGSAGGWGSFPLALDLYTACAEDGEVPSLAAGQFEPLPLDNLAVPPPPLDAAANIRK
jgi:hypothetical protein